MKDRLLHRGPAHHHYGSLRPMTARVRFTVVCPAHTQLARLFELAGLEGALSVHESANDALESWLDETGQLASR